MLVLMLPLMAQIAVVLRASVGAPVLSQQVRIGRGGRPFVMVKFRTMRRLTYGRMLLTTSLDELPMLWNVLTGDMSIVGPRPKYSKCFALLDKRQAREYLSARPSLISSWAVVLPSGSHSRVYRH